MKSYRDDIGHYTKGYNTQNLKCNNQLKIQQELENVTNDLGHIIMINDSNKLLSRKTLKL